MTCGNWALTSKDRQPDSVHRILQLLRAARLSIQSSVKLDTKCTTWTGGSVVVMNTLMIDNINSSHCCHRALVTKCLSKSHQIQHCTSSDPQQYTCPMWGSIRWTVLQICASDRQRFLELVDDIQLELSTGKRVKLAPHLKSVWVPLSKTNTNERRRSLFYWAALTLVNVGLCEYETALFKKTPKYFFHKWGTHSIRIIYFHRYLISYRWHI